MKEFALSTFWLNGGPLRSLLKVLNREGEARVVGGAVRNSVLGFPPGDIDIATDLSPERVERASQRAGFAVHRTGIAHGTLTIVADGQPFEVTTLREDVETDGRHAVVRFTDSWEMDARRRDFTMNALYVDANGNGIDYVGGYKDCLDQRVRFIGDPSARILEDHLRILRFFRFHASYGKGVPDVEGLAAVRQHKAAIATLPVERVTHEMMRLLKAPGAADVMDEIAAEDILAPFFPERPAADCYRALCAAERKTGRPLSETLAFLSLVRFDGEAFDALATRLKLSRRMRGRGLAAVAAAREMPPRSVPHVRALLYEHGAEAFTDGLIVALATGADVIDVPTLLTEARKWARPRFPVGGHDLMEQGGTGGAELGERLRRLERMWRDSDFSLSRHALLALDREMLATEER